MLMGPRSTWMGAFVVCVTAAIMCYYSVVAGWTVRYTLASIFGEIPTAIPGTLWTSFTTSWIPILTHGFMIGLAVFVVAKGVKGIERVTNVLMPSLIGIVIFLQQIPVFSFHDTYFAIELHLLDFKQPLPLMQSLFRNELFSTKSYSIVAWEVKIRIFIMLGQRKKQ